MQFNQASRISFNITTNISDKDRLDERLREIHEFLVSQNIHAPISRMDTDTGSCVIEFEFGDEDNRILMKALIEPRSNKERFKVSIQAVDSSLNLTNYCRDNFGKDATFMFREMINHLLKVSTQKPNKEDTAMEGQTSSPKVTPATPGAQQHMPEPARERTVIDGHDEELVAERATTKVD